MPANLFCRLPSIIIKEVFVASKIDYFYPFSKGFFGKTLLGQKQNVIEKKVLFMNVTHDSLSDFMKHFDDKIWKQNLERSPKTDIVKLEKIPKLFPNMVP